MAVLRSSRDFAERVETQFHRHGNSFRRVTWWTALFCAILVVCWLAWNGAQGEQRLYQAGPISTSHRMFENDCKQCHTTWSPVSRLVAFDDSIRSADDEQCKACHAGMPHDFPITDKLNPKSSDLLVAYNQLSEPACATCHREHQGRDGLAKVADRFCIDCHRSIKTFEDGHPEFGVHRLIQSNSDASSLEIGPDHGALAVMGQSASKWHDKAKIKFNHKKHLVTQLDGPFGTKVDLSNNCAICHESDQDRNYMKPINFERHCADCHPLVFDPNRVTGREHNNTKTSVFLIDDQNGILRNESGGADLDIKYMQDDVKRHANLEEDKSEIIPKDGMHFEPLVVPHGNLKVVRGYLTDFYRLQISKRHAASALETTDTNRGPDVLRNAIAGEIRQARVQAEQFVQDFNTTDFKIPQFRYMIAENTGGCFYCHTPTKTEKDSDDWGVLPPQIPDRWLTHSRFRHDPHRMLDCNECHKRNFEGNAKVNTSELTSDVLMPNISICRKCHNSGNPSMLEFSVSQFTPARTDCIECHIYHKRNGQPTQHHLENRYHRRDNGDSRYGEPIGTRKISDFFESKPK